VLKATNWLKQKNRSRMAGDLRAGVAKLANATPAKSRLQKYSQNHFVSVASRTMAGWSRTEYVSAVTTANLSLKEAVIGVVLSQFF
jgi:hypothetical protein